MESKDSQTARYFLKNKEETALPDIKNSYKATIVKTGWFLMLGNQWIRVM